MFIPAIPVRRAFNHNYDNEFYISRERIKVAIHNPKMQTGDKQEVNVILDDNSEWLISLEELQRMKR